MIAVRAIPNASEVIRAHGRELPDRGLSPMQFLQDIHVTPLDQDQVEWFVIGSATLGKEFAYSPTKCIFLELPDRTGWTRERLLGELNHTTSPCSRPTVFDPTKFADANKATRLMLFLTAACNLRCTYCHCNSVPDKSNMSDEILDRTLQQYLKFKKDKPDGPVGITFMGGGEPMLAFKKIKAIVSQLEDEHIAAEYALVTNATLGTDDAWEWILSKNFRVTISCDGPADIQDTQRPHANAKTSSSRLVEHRLRFLSSAGAKVHIRSTVIDAADVERCARYFMDFDSVATHSIEPVSIAGRADSLIGTTHVNHFYRRYFENYSKFLYADPSRFKSAWFKPFKTMDGFCGAVYYNNVVTHDGYVSLCTEVDSSAKDTALADFLVSTVHSDDPFNSEAGHRFSEQNRIPHLPACKTCVIRYKCGGGCYVKRAREFQQNPKGFKSAFCENAIRLNLSYLLCLANGHGHGSRSGTCAA